MGRCSKYSNYLPLPYFLIGIVNFPNGNFDNFDLRPPRSSLNHCSIPNLRREYLKAPDLIRIRFFWSDYKRDNPCGSRKKETKHMRYVRGALGSLKTEISCHCT